MGHTAEGESVAAMRVEELQEPAAPEAPMCGVPASAGRSAPHAGALHSAAHCAVGLECPLRVRNTDTFLDRTPSIGLDVSTFKGFTPDPRWCSMCLPQIQRSSLCVCRASTSGGLLIVPDILR